MRIALPLLLLVGALGVAAQAGEGTAPALKPGDPAPAWRLNDHEGRGRTLEAENDDAWLVLAFFPKAATPG